jgi:type IV pilus assembly protein PilY1
MNRRSKQAFRRGVAGIVALCMVAQPASAVLLNLATKPLYLTSPLPPKVMLLVSKDQQLYKKAYNDYTDLDGDGVLDTTYKHSISYYGYFDPKKCYTYSTATQRFEPASVMAEDAVTKVRPNATCTGQWSGNFLNWGTMTRMDAVRKLLYGGQREIDNASITTLQRAFLPTDAHAFAKYYVPTLPSDPAINALTPHNPRTTLPTAESSTDRDFKTGEQEWVVSTGFGTLFPRPGDQIRLEQKGNGSRRMIGWVTEVDVPGNKLKVHVNEAESIVSDISKTNNWVLTNLSRAGISLCNLTTGSNGGTEQFSHTNTRPPLVRVAQGNYALWSANERWQCRWSGEARNLQEGFNGGVKGSSNGNKAVLSGLGSSAENPSQTDHGLGTGSGQGEYQVRVEVCRSTLALRETENCKEYPNGNYKPVGLLQNYGETSLIHFGLMTGSYAKNTSGGVLRKNPGPLDDEINVATDGTFRTPPAAGSIINTLNRMRMYGYDYNDGTYIGADGNCDYQLTSLNEGQCSTWGNPMSEMYFEAVRYFAGRSATSAYNTTGGQDGTLGLTTATWTAPLDANNYCSPLSIVAFNSSVSSYDDDLRTQSAADVGASGSVQALTDLVGTREDVTGKLAFFGKAVGSGATPSSSSDFEMCTAKTVTSLGGLSGLCPEGPSVAGSYHIAGLAYHAKTNRIRSDLTVPAGDQKSLKVDTYGVQLSTNVPTITIPVPGGGGKSVVLQPAYRLDRSSSGAGPFGGGALVDLRVVQFDPAAGTGTLYVNWEDSEQGGDFDQDMWGMIRWSFPRAGVIRIETDAVSASSANGQGFGYILSGTTQDGAHFHSGIYNFDYTDPLNITVRNVKTDAILNGSGAVNTSGGCNNCNIGDPPSYVDYTIGSGSATPLQDPLFYAAKYGGFDDKNNDGRPDTKAEWDSFKVDGTGGEDGLPDNYFLVSNPLGLEMALNRVFIRILQVSSASSVATNSTSLQTGSRIYQAQFNPNDWSGKLLAYDIDLDGKIAPNPSWNSGELMNPLLNPSFSAGSRKIITFNKGISGSTPRGVPFRWPVNPASPSVDELAPGQVLALRTNAGGTLEVAAEGQKRLEYLRGSAAAEGPQPADYRRRDTSKLGDIANSNPTFVGPPAAGYFDASYATFRLNNINRTNVIYVGANDGMLHAFDASNGQELMAYVPSRVYRNLSRLTDKSYNANHRYFVDGTPEVQDACMDTTVGATCTTWRTMLVSSLGAGGQGIFALDVTSPSTFSEASASTIAKWEFTDADDPQLGYVLSQPVVRRMANGRFAAIFSSGYNSGESDGAVGNGDAHIFIVYLTGPTGTNGAWVENTDYVKIRATVSGFADNGFGQPFAADTNSDGRVDYIYAGDLTGRVWKFDVRSTTQSNWTAAAQQAVVFRAVDASSNAQPITGGIEASAHPNGGFIINVGTGKYLEPADLAGPFRTQTMYGFRDLNNVAPVSGQSTVVRGATNFQSQTVEAQVTVDLTAPCQAEATRRGLTGTPATEFVNNCKAEASTFRVTSNNTVAWTGGGAKQGWLMDFPASGGNPTGERSVFQPQLINGRLIFTTLIPSTAACEVGGTSFLMVLNNLTGSRFDESIFDTDNNRVFNASDMVSLPTGGSAYATGRASKVGITPSPTIIRLSQQGRTDASGGAIAVTSGSKALTESVRMNLGKAGQGRLNWREILND